MDPFSGSATTVVVAKKLGRQYVAFELSNEYGDRGLARLEKVAEGDALDGAPEPLVSAPATPGRVKDPAANGRPKKAKAAEKSGQLFQ
jgi:hypothetical protein